MTDRRFLAWAALLLGAYCTVDAIYILRFPLIMDEFEGAYSTFQFHAALPYRDFIPYKTVLGYYAQLPILLLPFSTWTNLLLVKAAMALATVASLFGACWMLRGQIRREALLASLAMLLSMSTFLERSAELRVDMLTAAVGLLSFAFLLRERPAIAGALAGLSFLVSQKGVFYAAAAAAAYLFAFAVTMDRRRLVLAATTFGVACATVVAAYVAIWSAIASWDAVIQTTFGSAAKMALLTDYSDIRARYWAQTLGRNPFFYAASIAGIAMLAFEGVRRRRIDDCSVAGYGVAIAIMGALTRQPWPYFFVIILPTALLTNAFAIDRLLASALWMRRRTLLLALFVVGGIALPLTRLAATLRRSNTMQHATVDLAERLVAPGERYLAAVDILYRREQSVPDLRWLDRVLITDLRRKTPAQFDALIRELDSVPTKLVIFNYRIAFLPPPLPEYLQSRFAPLWGNVLIYAPRLRPGTFALQFGGRYVVASDGPVSIDGRVFDNGMALELTRGAHTLGGRAARLTLRPDGVPERWQAPSDFFPNVYDF